MPQGTFGRSKRDPDSQAVAVGIAVVSSGACMELLGRIDAVAQSPWWIRAVVLLAVGAAVGVGTCWLLLRRQSSKKRLETLLQGSDRRVRQLSLYALVAGASGFALCFAVTGLSIFLALALADLVLVGLLYVLMRRE